MEPENWKSEGFPNHGEEVSTFSRIPVTLTRQSYLSLVNFRLRQGWGEKMAGGGGEREREKYPRRL